MTTPDLAELRDTPVRTPLQLMDLWRALMGEGGFGRRTLWLTFLEADGRPFPHIVPIDDIPLTPRPEELTGLRTIVTEVVGTNDIAFVVMLLSRPGSSAMSSADREWARALAPLTPQWPIHLATADHVQVFAPDDLLPDTLRRR